jgi:hypothetical protein
VLGVASFGLLAPLCRAESPILGTVAQILTLTPDKQRQGQPVRIRGVVTEYGVLKFQGEEYPNLFLQDATGGIYVALSVRTSTEHDMRPACRGRGDMQSLL